MATRADSHRKSGLSVDEHENSANRVSTHIAYALVLYTLLLIFMVSPQMESKGMSILPYFVLVALVAAVIIPCRNLERRWQTMEAISGDDQSGRCTRDIILLWLAAVGIPTFLMFIFWVIP